MEGDFVKIVLRTRRPKALSAGLLLLAVETEDSAAAESMLARTADNSNDIVAEVS